MGFLDAGMEGKEEVKMQKEEVVRDEGGVGGRGGFNLSFLLYQEHLNEITNEPV